MLNKQQLITTWHRLSTYLQTGWRPQVLTASFFLLSLAVAASILIASRETLESYPWQVHPGWVFCALLLLAIDLLLGSYAWHLLVSRLTSGSSLRYDIKCWHYSNLARRVPGPIWYIASRAILYEQKQISKTTTSLVSGLELALIFLSGVAVFLLSTPFWVISAEVVEQLNQSWMLLIVLIFCLIFIHPQVLNKIWAKMSQHPPEQRLKWLNTAIWFTFYIIIWIIGAGALFSIINIFTPLPVTHFIPVAGMWALANVISVAGTVAFSGIGLREISLAVLLTQFIPLPVAVIIAILSRLIWLIAESIGALLSLLL